MLLKCAVFFAILIPYETWGIDVFKNEIFEPTPCQCGVFLTGQYQKGQPPKGNPVLMYEMDQAFISGPLGVRQCTNKCLETIVKHLANSAELVCATSERDCMKERAYLFIKNHEPEWKATNLSAGREFCCKDGKPVKCPL